MAKNTSSAARNAMRAALFDSKNQTFKVIQITMFGQKVDVRQPSIDQIERITQKFREDTENERSAIVRMIISYCYVPGTEEKVFEDADADMLLTLPGGGWLTEFNKAVSALTELDVGEAEKNSDKAA